MSTLTQSVLSKNISPMAGSTKSLLNAVVVIDVVLWLLNVFGLFHFLSRVRIGWQTR